MKYLTRNIWMLSLVSLFTDVASEMLYPVLPIYLKSIGFSILLIGILEGMAEATAGLSKGYFGHLSDRKGKRLPFVQWGYALSSLSKPMMAAFVFPIWIFFARTIDRLGKGIRTGARDALLSDESSRETKGKVFGFHRALDTLGAATGPALALVFLYFWPGSYRTLFVIAFVPGMLAVLLTLFIREQKKETISQSPRPRFLDFTKYWKSSPILYRRLTAALLLFTLFNSSDVFLLLKVKDLGFDDTTVIGVYIFYNLVFAISAFPLGGLADRFGMKKVMVAGMLFFALAYISLSLASRITMVVFVFFLYGIYAAATEGIAKAWISNICQTKDTATAIGTFTAFQSICTLLASSLAGLIWYKFGAYYVFFLSGIVAIMVAFYISTLPSKSHQD